MRKYLDPVAKANEIRLLLKHPSHKDNMIIILEGETDIRLFRSLLKHECISLESVDGKLDLIQVVEELNGDSTGSVIGVCDADYDHILNIAEDREKSGVYLTDVHDAEMMMFESASLKSYIDEYTNQDNYIEVSEGLKYSVISASRRIGFLRLINIKEHLNINFKGLNFNSFVDVSKLDVNVDVEALIDLLLGRSRNLKNGVTKEYLNEKYNEYSEKDYPDNQLCCGHDITNIVAMIYSQKWASCDTNLNREKVEAALRIGYTMDEFSKTKLFKSIFDAAKRFGFDIKGTTNCNNLDNLMLRSA